jgi:hypothetical protein
LLSFRNFRSPKAFHDGQVKVYFTYDRSGLRIQIYSIQPDFKNNVRVPGSYAEYKQFFGYTPEQQQRIQASMEAFENEARKNWIDLFAANALREIGK